MKRCLGVWFVLTLASCSNDDGMENRDGLSDNSEPVPSGDDTAQPSASSDAPVPTPDQSTTSSPTVPTPSSQPDDGPTGATPPPVSGGEGGATVDPGPTPAGSAGDSSAGSAGGAGGGVTGPDVPPAGEGPGCLEFTEPSTAGRFANPQLNGPSGLAASRQYPGVLYAQLDTGGPASVFATTTDGRDLAQYALEDLEQNDWEDIAVGPGPDGKQYIFVGDIGDNAAGGMGGGSARAEVQIYRFAEPEVSLSMDSAVVDVSWEVLRFTYPDGARNAETLLVDPQSQDIFILTKDSGDATIYRAAGDVATDTPTVLEEVGTVDVGSAQLAAGDISPSGDRILLRTYDELLIWERRVGTDVATALSADATRLTVADEPRSEGATFAGDGSAWFSAGEEDDALYTGVSTCD